MRYNGLKLCAISTFLLFSGCAALYPDERPLTPLPGENLEMLEVKKSIAEMNLKIEELNNKVMLLQEKIEASREKIENLGSAPPEGLKVVKLKEEEKAPDPEKLYNRGQNLIISGKYAEARGVFEEFVKNHPSHDLSDNALYWAGEAYYAERNYKNSIVKFKELLNRYPEGNKAPDAMLKLAYSYLELEEIKKGADLLDELIRRHPRSEAAEKAKKKLKKP